MSSEAPRFGEEQLEGAIALASHLAVLFFGVGLGVVFLGTAVQGAVGPFLAGDPVAGVLADGQRWAYLSVAASMAFFGVGAVLHHRLDNESEAAADGPDGSV